MHIPRVICEECRVEMRPKQVGVRVEMLSGGDSHIKVAADMVACEECGHAVLLTARAATAEHWEPKYSAIRTDVTARYAD